MSKRRQTVSQRRQKTSKNRRFATSQPAKSPHEPSTPRPAEKEAGEEEIAADAEDRPRGH
jgi:hypothetical protein